MSLTSNLQRAAQVNRNGLSTVCGARSRTWAQTLARVSRLAASFHRLGVRRGDRVAILAKNTDRYLEYYYATFWAGCIAVPLNTRWAVPEMVFALDDSGAQLLLVDDSFVEVVPQLRHEARSMQALVYCGERDAPAGMHDYEALAQAQKSMDDARCGWDEVAAIFYTGGTTGRSKGVMLTHSNLLSNSLIEGIWLGFRDDSSYLHAAPSFHLADAAAGFAVSAAGGTNVYIDGFEPGAVLRSIASCKVTHLLLVPTMLQMLLDDPSFGDTDVSSLQSILYGAAPISESLLRRTLAALPGVSFVQGYGMTETTAISVVLEPKYHVLDGPRAGRLRSVGRATAHVQVRIVDPDGKPVSAGTVGEITISGPSVMRGYWNQPELTAASIRDGWMMTGDAGYMDEDGFIYLVDRIKDMIISGGENIYSAEVENAIASHPDVAFCAVVGRPDPSWGEAVHAYVWLKPQARSTQQDIIGHCRKLIAGYKCPKSVEIAAFEVPLSAAGKIRKDVLRQMAREAVTAA